MKKHLLLSIITYILISVTAKVYAQETISYAPSTNVYTVGTPITPLTPTVGPGPADSYSIDIALPAGLSFDTTTGIISGTPGAVSSATTYTVTAVSTANGNGTTTITLTVNPIAPAISYTSPNTFVYGTTITSLSPSNSGGPPDSYSISPALPSGLSFDTGTGVISGTPAAIAAAADYTVTATNAGGTSTFSVNITVGKAVLTISTPAASDKVYDRTTTATITGTLSGIVGSDVVTFNGTGTFASSSVANGIAVTSTSTLSGPQAGNYTLTQPTGLTANITAKALTVTTPAASDKVYDRTNAATITGTLSGIVGSDAVTLNGTGTFATANVGTGIAVTSTSTLGGADAANYTLTQPTGLTANITARALTITTPAASDKVYDRTTAATITGTLSGIVGSDAVTLNGTGTFATANVGTGIAVTSTSTLGGAQAGNYTLTQPTGLTANITAKALTITTPAASNKVYDGTPAATITGTLSGIVGSDVVTLNGTGTFASSAVANGIAVTSTSTLGGAQAGNYTLTQPTGLTANITAKALTVTSAAASNKVYDRTTAATITGTLSGIVGSDAVTLNGTGTFATANVGTGIAVTSTSTLGGADAANYTLTQPTGLTANITAIALTISGATANNKVYDKTTAATITGTLSGILGSDVVTLNGTGTFATANIGTGIAVTSTSTLGGAQAGNYTLTQPTGLTANITGITLTLTGLTANNKVYDGNTNVISFTGGTLNGVLPGDVVTFAASGTFATANVGTGIAVTSTTTLGGAQGGNYTLTQPTGLTANITVKTLTLTGAAAVTKVYDATTAATITATLNGVVAGDVVTFSGTGTFASKNVGNGIAVTSTSTLTGAQAGNYTFAQPTGLTANITPFTLTFTFSPVHPDKTYDGTTAATVGSATINVFAADAANVTLGGTPVGTFNSASVGNAKTVTITGYTISGTAISNYTLNQPTISGVKINAAALTITASDVSKVYGNTLATPVTGSTAFTSAGLVNGETIGSVTINYGTARAATTAVGTYPGQVTITSGSASGGTFTASNYSITLAAGAILVGSAPFNWTGASNSDWATPGNWTSAGIVQTTNYPGLQEATDVANIGVNNSFTNNPNIAATLPNSLAGLNFGTGPGTINLTVNTGVTLTTSGNLTLTGTETVNMTATNPTITIGGNYSSASGTTFNKGGSNPMTITGTTSNAGTFNQSGTGLVTMTGAITNTGTINQTSTGNMVFTGNFNNSGSSSALKQTGTGSLTFSGTLTNGGTFTQGGGLVSVASALNNTGTLNVGTSTFTVTGDFTNSGTYTQGTGTILFNNPSIQFLNDASSAGTIFTNVNFNNGPNTKLQTGNFGIASTGVLTLSGTNTKVTVVSALTIYSDANSTGTVAALSNNCKIQGNVTVQRYLSAARGYRLIASPVNSATVGSNSVYSLNYVKNAAYITGTNATGDINNGGFDKVQPGPTLYLYRENVPVLNTSFINGNYQSINDLNNGTNATPTYTFDYTSTTGSYSIPVSNGFLFFFRGNRASGTLTQETTVGWPATAATLSTTGALNQNQVVFRDWYTPGSNILGFSNPNVAAQGFNLAGNPYASSIDLDTYNTTTTTSGIYTQNVSQFMYELNPNTLNYDTYKAGSATAGLIINTNHGGRTIVSGQGFFVLALNTGPAQLIFNESAKVNTQVPINVGSGNTNPALMMAARFSNDQRLRLQLAKDTVNTDDILIRFDPNSKDTFAINEDAPYKVGSGKVSLSSFSADHVNLAINQLPFAVQGQKIHLKVSATTDGTYKLNMIEFKGIPQLFNVWLKDNFLKDSVNMRTNSSYSFSILHSDTNTFGSNRFVVVINQNPDYAYRLLSFNATKLSAERAVQVAWKTEYEDNYTNFTVERSVDNGKTFNALGSVGSVNLGSYTLVDAHPIVGQNLYRLKQVDINNNITYSKVVPVSYSNLSNSIAKNNISIFPNPTTSNVNLAVLTDLTNSTAYNIKITNSAGFVVKEATTNQPNWQLNISDWLPGTYLVKVFSSKDQSEVGTTKFVKL